MRERGCFPATPPASPAYLAERGTRVRHQELAVRAFVLGAAIALSELTASIASRPNDANEKIGDISEVILDRSSKVANVVIGVGGFLGVGEHDVAFSYDKIKWVDHPVMSTTTTSSSAKSTSATTTTASSSSGNWYPDHAVFNATKDQLKALPQFQH
jgi:hypothetical protein